MSEGVENLMDEPRPFVMALDGPAASGKSTVGMAAARRLGFFYFDTGLLYRGLTWVALQRNVPLEDGETLAGLVWTVPLEARPPSVADGRQVDLLAGSEDISDKLRRPEVDANVSLVSSHAAVRQALIAPQRAAVRPPGTILAGRDIGTVIVPDAQLKLWITASAEERARRRAVQSGAAYGPVLHAMVERDRFDGTRAVAPMAKAPDAIEINTDEVPVEEVVDRVVALTRERMDEQGRGGRQTPLSHGEIGGG